MSTIRGIFEPFYSYVSNQLTDRKMLLSNRIIIPSSRKGYDNSDSSFNLGEGIRNQRAFHAFTTEKQCVIRMASGVDIREKNTLLDKDEKLYVGSLLARNWVLEGGNKTYKGFDSSYNSKKYRSNPQDGFGMVPPPGITDATIDTKSEDGSLREATINFVCHNRRQLEILETLYMRPGYPILLEWGWDPYISFNEGGDPVNAFTVNENDFSVLGDFFKSESTINGLNDKISLYKNNSEGNYDGFIGFVKNFSFKVREDGGYDCITEVIAHGEILESLKATALIKSKLYSVGDKEIYSSQNQQTLDEKEITDEFLYYLKSIKANLDKAGNKAIIEYTGTDRETISFTNFDKITVNTQEEIDREINQSINSVPAEDVLREKDIHYKDDEGEVIPIYRLNQVVNDYKEGMGDIKKLIKEVAKIGDPELILSKKEWQDVPLDIGRTEKIST